MTNYERIKNMSVEKMAEIFANRFFATKRDACKVCPWYDYCINIKCKKSCRGVVINWLNQEVEK